MAGVANIDDQDALLPRIRFRWCRTVPCQTKEVYLILTTISGPQVHLEWKSDLGWYESALVPLPCGIHSGSIRIREKVRSHDASPSVKERDYKIDSFFVSPHKFAVEIFVQNEQNNCVSGEETFNKRNRNFSSHQIGSSSEGSNASTKTSVTPRKCLSFEELKRSSRWAEDITDKPEIRFTSPVEWSSFKLKWNSHASSSGLGFGEEASASSSRLINLRKWLSLGERSELSLDKYTPDSLYHSRSRSLCHDPNNEDTHSVELTTKKSKSDGDKVYSGSDRRPIKQKYFSQIQLIDYLEPDINQLVADVSARSEDIDNLLKHSDEEQEQKEKEVEEISLRDYTSNLYFKEVDPPENEGYGCLITFESRSTSMNDVGSPRALEDAIVSLTSTDTDPRIHHSSLETDSIPKIITSSFDQEPEDSHREVDNARIQQESKCQNYSRFPLKTKKKHLGNSVDIREDENFHFDSLRIDDRKIPLNVRSVLSSDESFDYSLNLDSKLSGNRSSLSESLNSTRSNADHSRQDCQIQNHNLENHQNSVEKNYINSSLTSKEGNTTNDSLLFVNPGSLRSDTETSRTIVGSFESSESFVGREDSIETSNRHQKTNEKELESQSYPIIKSTLLADSKQEEKITSENLLLTSPSNANAKIKDGKQLPKMSSTGTQTSYRESLSNRLHQIGKHRSFSSSLSSSGKENLNFSPLPDKMNGPWSSKFPSERKKSPEYPYSSSSKIRHLQKYLYNLAKADEILKTIHPFDYRPTLLHKINISDPIYNRPFRPSRKSNLKIDKNNTDSFYSSSYNSFPRSMEESISSQRYNRTRKLERNFYDPYISSTRLKMVSNPIFSIYGKDATESNDRTTKRRNSHSVKFSTHLSSSEYDSDFSPLRPTISMPNLQETFDDGYHTLPLRSHETDNSWRNSSSSTDAKIREQLRQDRSGASGATLCRRRYSLGNPVVSYDDQGNTTDALIEEAADISNGILKRSKISDIRRDETYVSRSTRENNVGYRRRRAKSTSDYMDIPVTQLESASPLSSFGQENSVSDSLRARSETDLRMVGTLAGGYYRQPPYLPYSKDELTLGQVVKVLVPGEGVAMAKIVYNPQSDALRLRRQFSRSDNVTVLLLTEPNSYSGSVISVPLKKILLAWPKS